MAPDDDPSAGLPSPHPRVVMAIHFPVSGKSFVMPQVQALNRADIPAELWVQGSPRHQAFLDAMEGPKRLIECDLTANPFTFLRRLLAFRRCLLATRPTVLHAHQMRASIIPLLAAVLAGTRIRIYQNHGLPYLGYRGWRRWMLRTLERINIRLATHVLLVSHSNLEAAVEDGLLAPGQGTVLGEGTAVGMDPEKYRPATGAERSAAKASFGFADDHFVLGYVGRPVRRKGFHLLLDAWRRSGLGEGSGRLLIAGCTSKETQSAAGDAIPGVLPVGYIADMDRFHAACDAATLPSEHEGFPTAILEAAACGLPTIGTDIPGIRCAITSDLTGLLVPCKDARALADAIVHLAKSPELRRKLGGRARQRVIHSFQRDTVLAALVAYYRDELGVHPRPATRDRSTATAA